MDEAASESGSGVGKGSEARSPEELRREIEQTREALGDTVEALAEKTDVKAQARQRVSAVKESAQAKKDEFVGRAKEATPDSAQQGVRQVAGAAQEQPLPFAAAGAFAAGLLLGFLLGRRGGDGA